MGDTYSDGLSPVRQTGVPVIKLSILVGIITIRNRVVVAEVGWELDCLLCSGDDPSVSALRRLDWVS